MAGFMLTLKREKNKEGKEVIRSTVENEKSMKSRTLGAWRLVRLRVVGPMH
jgi:hypothetical protein